MSKAEIEAARKILDDVDCVVAFSGAGLSAESGVSTFRDTETDALWSKFDPMMLASPEGFAVQPDTVVDWYNWRRAALADVQPNPAHVALSAQKNLINITQNVDDLLERAGVEENHVLHLHGSILYDRCHSDCGFMEKIELKAAAPLRKCPECGAVLRPGVVWFGEALPQEIWYEAERLCSTVDCLLAVGTSATVYPAAGLIQQAKDNGARIIVINTQSSEASGLADVEILGKAGEVLPELLEGMSLKSRYSF